MYCIVSYVTKVNGSTLLKDCTTKNGQINAATMKDEASCNAKRKNIDVNMKAATTVENIKEPSHCATYANGKDESVLSRVPVLLAGTSKSDMGINTMNVAAAINMKGKISFYHYFEEQQMPFEFFNL